MCLHGKGKLVYREINKRKIILEKRKPYSRSVAGRINEMNVLDFVYTGMRLNGSVLTRENAAAMLAGFVTSAVMWKMLL